MKKINWGIIGLGNIAKNFSDGFYNVNNSRLLAVSSRDSKKLEIFKKKFDIHKNYVFNNYEEILDCKDVDIVYITLPNNFHYEWIIKAINKNKKILVEKPAVLNFSDAKKIQKKILEKNLFFTEGYMYRFYPQIKKITEIIKNEEIGIPFSMETSFGSNLLTKKKFIFLKKKKKIDPNNRLFNKKLGGGCILDLGCYTTSFSLLVSSLVKNINFKNFQLKDVKKKIGSTGVEIDAEGKLIFEGGFTSKIKASFEKNIGNKSVINGDKGSLIIKDTWFGKSEIEKIISGKKTIIKNDIIKNIYSYQIEAISKCLIEDKKEVFFPGFKIEDTVQNTKILENWLNG
ncbi:Gfo/Idh/MocA family oxidoreductase [Candidatus Pelagibacter sp.]|nr:Gfo/Idh/MocA family oxidoreductase [Candidatus Pelagibacter sp.]